MVTNVAESGLGSLRATLADVVNGDTIMFAVTGTTFKPKHHSGVAAKKHKKRRNAGLISRFTADDFFTKH